MEMRGGFFQLGELGNSQKQASAFGENIQDQTAGECASRFSLPSMQRPEPSLTLL
jgi:hypothetical protein